MSTLASGRYAPVAAGSAGWPDFAGFFSALARYFEETSARVETHYRNLQKMHLGREMSMLDGE